MIDLVGLGTMVFLYSIVQSVFGVGILLIGTPTLLFFGYDYFAILGILLPISLAVSLTQVWEFKGDIDKKFISKIIYLAVPLIPVGMYFSSFAKNYLGIVIGFLLLTVCSGKIQLKDRFLNAKFIFLGLMHGLTNLGGAILPTLTFGEVPRKHLANIACAYLILVSMQLLTLYLMEPIVFQKNVFAEIAFIFIALVGGQIFGRIILLKFNPKKYSWALRVYIGLIGSFLILKNCL